MSKTLFEEVQEGNALEVTTTIESLLMKKTLEAIEETRKQVAADTFGMEFEQSEESRLNEEIDTAYEGLYQLTEKSEADHVMAKDLADKALYHHDQYHKGNRDERHGGWAMHDLNTWAKNYQRKKEKGTYNPEKAVKGLTHAVKNSEAAYFGGSHHQTWKNSPAKGHVSGATRTAAARHLLPHVEKLMPNHAKKKAVKEEAIAEGTPRKNHNMNYRLMQHGFKYKGANGRFHEFENDEGHTIRHQYPTVLGNHSFEHKDPSGKTVWKSPQTGDTDIHQHLEKHFPKKLSEAEIEEGLFDFFKRKKEPSLADHLHSINKDLQTKKNNVAHAQRLHGKADSLLAKKGLNPNNVKATVLHGKADALLAKRKLKPIMASEAEKEHHAVPPPAHKPLAKKPELTAASLWKGLGGKRKAGKQPVTAKDLMGMREAEYDPKDVAKPEEVASHDKMVSRVRAKAATKQAEFNAHWKAAHEAGDEEKKKQLKKHAFAHDLDIPWMSDPKSKSRSPVHDFAHAHEAVCHNCDNYSDECTCLKEEYLTEISQAIPWPACSKHLKDYTKKKGEEGPFKHPEGHSIEISKDKGEITHTDNKGNKKTFKKLGDLHVHLMKLHGKFDDKVKEHEKQGWSHCSTHMGKLSYKHHKKGEGDPEENAVDYKAAHRAAMNIQGRERKATRAVYDAAHKE